MLERAKSSLAAEDRGGGASADMVQSRLYSPMHGRSSDSEFGAVTLMSIAQLCPKKDSPLLDIAEPPRVESADSTSTTGSSGVAVGGPPGNMCGRNTESARGAVSVTVSKGSSGWGLTLSSSTNGRPGTYVTELSKGGAARSALASVGLAVVDGLRIVSIDFVDLRGSVSKDCAAVLRSNSTGRIALDVQLDPRGYKRLRSESIASVKSSPQKARRNTTGAAAGTGDINTAVSSACHTMTGDAVTRTGSAPQPSMPSPLSSRKPIDGGRKPSPNADLAKASRRASGDDGVASSPSPLAGIKSTDSADAPLESMACGSTPRSLLTTIPGSPALQNESML